jgi:fibro-slime domain-containing protein
LLLAALAGVAGVMAWRGVALKPSEAANPATPPATYPLIGIVRDFAPGVADFAPGVADGIGHSVGNIATSLNANGLPVFKGGGILVRSEARDAQGRAIAPNMSGVGPLSNYSISGASVTSSRGMAAKITVIGAKISYGGQYDVPVSMQVNAGASTLVPFGSFGGAVSGNVNDNRNPRSFVLPSIIAPGDRLSIDARSWVKKQSSSASLADGDWSEYMRVNSAAGTAQVRALRNGDSVPSVAGFMNQNSVSQMVAGYVDSATRKIRLADNQVIYLFELGSSDSSSSAFDMQDLVVLVDLATDPSYFTSPGSSIPPCGTINDTPAVMGAASNGGVASASSFSQWFMDSSGVNVSDRLTLQMTRGADGAYTYSTPDFHPIDGEAYGNQGLAHNRGFTFAFGGTVSYCRCTGQYFEYAGDGDAWLFVNGKLVLDMGGHHAGTRQVIDLDRLGLSDGAEAHLQFFYAERATSTAAFELKTNMVLRSDINSVNAPAVTGLRD